MCPYTIDVIYLSGKMQRRTEKAATNEHVNVNPGGGHLTDPRNSDEKRVVSQNPHPAIAFTIRIPPKIYISTICNVRIMPERIPVVRVPCMVRQTPVICLGPQDSLG